MLRKRKKAGWLMLAAALVPVGSLPAVGPELKRLPPVESEVFDATPVSPIPRVTSNLPPGLVSHLVFHDNQADAANAVRPARNEQVYVPPVFVASDPSGVGRPPALLASSTTSASNSSANATQSAMRTANPAVPSAPPTTASTDSAIAPSPPAATAPEETAAARQLNNPLRASSPTPAPAPEIAKPVSQPPVELAVPFSTKTQTPATFASSRATSTVEPPKPAQPTATATPATPAVPSEAPNTLPANPPANAPAEAPAEAIDPGLAVEDPDLDCEFSYGYLPPCWYGQAEALLLFRSDSRTIKIVEHGTGAPVRGQRDPYLTTDDLDHDQGWGPRLMIGRYVNDRHNLELSYFGFQHWQSYAAFDGINGTGFSFNNIDVPFDSNYTSDFDGAQFISARYSSEVHNAEANLVTNNRWDLNTSWGFPWYRYTDFLVGLRYFGLNEHFNLQSTDFGQTSNYLINTTNHMFGSQVGMIWGTHAHPNVRWNITTKAGVFLNVAEQDTWMADDNNTVLLRDFTANRDSVSFLGDTSFSLAFQVRPNVSLTLGYYLLYVGGLALAPEQLDFTTTPTSGSSIDTSGHAFYHGALAGLQFNY